MYYTDEEDIRLVSAWLNNSTDPVEGNSKKLARYWEEVAAAYNETTPSDCKRDVKHLKSHWYKTTKKISGFNGCYNQMEDAYQSGRSDDQLMNQALDLYLRPLICTAADTSTTSPMFIGGRLFVTVQSGIHTLQRKAKAQRGRLQSKMPTRQLQMGAQLAARKLKMRAFGNGTATTVVEEQLEKLVNAQIEINACINNMKVFQERLSTQKVEATKLTYMAAKENKEAKLLENKSKSMEHRSKLMDKFSEMLNIDTSKTEPWAKEAHVKAQRL